MNLDAMKSRLDELDPPIKRYRDSKMLDDDDLLRFDVRIFPPIGYWIEPNDIITDRIVKLLSDRYTGTQINSLFRASEGKTKNKYNCEYTCRTCHKKETTRLKMGDVYLITFSNGIRTTILGLKKFCKENNYDRKNVYRVMVGYQSYHKDIIKVEKVDRISHLPK